MTSCFLYSYSIHIQFLFAFLSSRFLISSLRRFISARSFLHQKRSMSRADIAAARIVIPINEKLIAFGEIGLSGEIRSVSRAQARVNEAARLGFTVCVMPKASLKQVTSCPANLKLIGVKSLSEAISLIK